MSSIIILLCKVSNVLAFCGMSVGVVFHCINILTMTLVWSFQWIVFGTAKASYYCYYYFGRESVFPSCFSNDFVSC